MKERTIGMLVAGIAVMSLTVGVTAEQIAQKAAAAAGEVAQEAVSGTEEATVQAAEKTAPSAEELLAQAQAALENEDYEAAINAAELILSQNEDSAQAKSILETAKAKQAAAEEAAAAAEGDVESTVTK